jgi:hypothetical protein
LASPFRSIVKTRATGDSTPGVIGPSYKNGEFLTSS